MIEALVVMRVLMEQLWIRNVLALEFSQVAGMIPP